MAPAALSYVYCTQTDLESLLSVPGVEGRVDDNADAVAGTTEQTYVTAAINWATARVNFYCLANYAASDLAQSWIVNNWCVILAAQWLSVRRGNPAPGSLDDLYKEALEDLKQVRSGAAQIPDIGQRDAAWPAWSNVRVDSLYALRRIRVQRPISEKSSTQGAYTQQRDIASEFIVEPN